GHGLVFFFSSRRRHTRWPRDWSSDVCSSDLIAGGGMLATSVGGVAVSTKEASMPPPAMPSAAGTDCALISRQLLACSAVAAKVRSEERRVGKEWRAWW